MSSANAIHLKRLKRKRILERRWKAYGSVFNHFTMFGKPKAKAPEMVLPTPITVNRQGIFSRFINWIKSFETKTVRFFNPALGYSKIKLEIDAAMQDVLARGDLIMRKDMEQFEASLCEYTGRKYAVALNSGTDALYLSLWALGIGAGDEVIVPSHTFVASVQVIQQLGATPVIVDVKNDLLCHEEDVALLITDKTKAIIPVHLTGDVAQFSKEFVDMLVEKNIFIIEDAAQALGATGVGFGDTQCYSFYPAKILGAYGDGGAITTDDEQIANHVRELRNHWKSDYSNWGINSRMDNIQAAVLNVKMKHLAEAQIKRWKVANMYKTLEGVGTLQLPEYTSGRVWQDYVIRLKNRDGLFDHLKRCGVETMKNEYPMPCVKRDNALKIESETLRIPCNEHLTEEDVYHIVKSIKSFFV
jgi:dTDP-4-amino-4,6-dideoxygalactose transaminase